MNLAKRKKKWKYSFQKIKVKIRIVRIALIHNNLSVKFTKHLNATFETTLFPIPSQLNLF